VPADAVRSLRRATYGRYVVPRTSTDAGEPGGPGTAADVANLPLPAVGALPTPSYRRLVQDARRGSS